MSQTSEHVTSGIRSEVSFKYLWEVLFFWIITWLILMVRRRMKGYFMKKYN